MIPLTNEGTPMTALCPFHLAFPVDDLAAARDFYGNLLGCSEGRSSSEWIDFNFYGHQIVAHLAPDEAGAVPANAVDGHGVPVPDLKMLTASVNIDAMRKFGQAGNGVSMYAKITMEDGTVHYVNRDGKAFATFDIPRASFDVT